MDTTANALIEDLNDILSDFKSYMIESYEEREDEMEEKIDNLIKEVNELFSSSYA
tara:strand:- start:1964 stop:2128 length:165 start_codon:yes stop_codon:yes gene_type:complete